MDEMVGTTTRYPRVEFRVCDPDAEPWQPSWQNAIPVVNTTLRGWLERLDDAPFYEVVKDDDGRRWHVTGEAVAEGLNWRVELAGYNWFLSARSELGGSLPSDHA
jgi:hypothetical protein